MSLERTLSQWREAEIEALKEEAVWLRALLSAYRHSAALSTPRRPLSYAERSRATMARCYLTLEHSRDLLRRTRPLIRRKDPDARNPADRPPPPGPCPPRRG